MTILEMHIALRNELDKTQDYQYPDFLPEQIDYWLNKAQEIYIEDTAYPMNPNKIAFEQTQKRIDELKDLVKPATITATQSGTNYLTQLPNDYKHLVRHECKTVKNGKSEIVSGIITTQDKINLQKKNPFWTPIVDEPLYYILGNSIVYETLNRFNIEQSYLWYIKEPIKMKLGSEYTDISIDVDCEIKSEYVQHRIIDIARSMMLENIESPRYESNLIELNKTD